MKSRIYRIDIKVAHFLWNKQIERERASVMAVFIVYIHKVSDK